MSGKKQYMTIKIKEQLQNEAIELAKYQKEFIANDQKQEFLNKTLDEKFDILYDLIIQLKEEINEIDNTICQM